MNVAWPVPQWIASFSYHHPPRSFGARRDHGRRKHAGCDLYAPNGSPVVAMFAGRVRAVYEFYGKADAVEVDHGMHGVIRYGELHASDDIDVGSIVEAGTPIGSVATLVGIGGNIHPMLHLEMYTGKAHGRLTVPGNAFVRRSDLVDPTATLDRVRAMTHAGTPAFRPPAAPAGQ